MRPLFSFVTFALTLFAALPLSAQAPVKIKSTSAPKWGANVQLKPAWSIGSLDGEIEYTFGSVQYLTVDKKERVYLFDGQETQIRAYDAKGKFLRNVGRKGEGPGEYSTVGALDILNDSILVVHDPRNSRVSLFLPSGKLLRSIRLARGSGYGGRSMAVDINGLISYMVMKNGAEMHESAEVAAGPSQFIYLRMKADGTPVDSVLLPPIMAVPRMFYLMSADGGTGNFFPETWTAPYTGGGAISGNGDSLRFSIIQPKAPTRIIERAWKPIEIVGEERAMWEAWITYFSEREKNQWKYTIPKTKPAFRDIVSDQDARIWLSVYATGEKIERKPRPAGDKRPLNNWVQRATYEVFDRTGAYLGRVVLPSKSQFMAARGNKIYTLSKGVEEEEHVSVFTIAGASDKAPAVPLRGGGKQP